jgi:hypothetical protein
MDIITVINKEYIESGQEIEYEESDQEIEDKPFSQIEKDYDWSSVYYEGTLYNWLDMVIDPKFTKLYHIETLEYSNYLICHDLLKKRIDCEFELPETSYNGYNLRIS